MDPWVPPDADDGAALTRLAVAAVRARLLAEQFSPPVPERTGLLPVGASFVTLERGGALRGCIGSLEPTRPLYLDVVRNACRAMADPRLAPVTAAEWTTLDVKVSVLGPLVDLPVGSRAELLAALRPGLDGLLLTDSGRRSTFLPGVWRSLPDPDRFVAALLVKGGWPAHGWPSGLAVHRYTSVEYVHPCPRPPLPG